MIEMTTELPTGITVAAGTMKATTMTLRELWGTRPIAALELLTLARDPQHQPFGNTGEILRNYGLINELGVLHADTRAVVLASFVGEGMDLEFHPLTWQES